MKMETKWGAETIDVELDRLERKVYLLVDGGYYEPKLGAYLTKKEAKQLANELLSIAEQMEED